MNYIKFVLLFFAFVQMVSIHAMENASLEFKKYFEQEPNARSAVRVFGDTGIVAMTDLLEYDKKLKGKKDEGEVLLQQLFDIASNYGVLVDTTDRIMNVHINTLPGIYSNAIYDEFVHDITKTYNNLFEIAKRKGQSDAQAQKFFAIAHCAIESLSVERETARQMLFETKMIEILTGHHNKINSSLWPLNDLSFEAMKMLLQEYKTCIKHFCYDNGRKDAQKNYIKMCYNFSYCAWLHNFNEIALKYSKKASAKALEFDQNEPIAQRTLTNWHIMLSGKKHNEISAGPTKKVFVKRKCPMPKPSGKKQKSCCE